MNFSNYENDENLVFSRIFPFLPNFRLLQNQNQGKFRKPQQQKFRSTSNNVIYAKRFVLGLNRFYSGHFQNTPNIKTFFGYVGHIRRRIKMDKD